MEKEQTYIAIDLKSFFASVECAERHLNPLTTNLVVADESRTEISVPRETGEAKRGVQICLAVSPSLKAYGISGRARLFEAVQRVREINNERRSMIPGYRFTGKSTDDNEIKAHPNWELDFIRAVPRMSYYITVTYFQPDERKAGGSYQSHTENLKNIDDYEQMFLLTDGTPIPILSIFDIDCNLFDNNVFSIKRKKRVG